MTDGHGHGYAHLADSGLTDSAGILVLSFPRYHGPSRIL
jgi:hypothetical protein